MPVPEPVTTAIRSVAVRGLLLKERLQSGVSFNLLAKDLRTNPYPIYHRLRGKDPVHKSELARGWVASTYADVSAVLRDPRFSVDSTKGGAFNPAELGAFAEVFARTMLFKDPPDHERLRTLVSKAFTPKTIQAMRPRIEEIVAELLDAVQERGRMDVIRDLAYPLPVIVIAEMLGVPPEDRDKFKRWSDDIGEGLEPILTRDQIDRANRSTLEMTAYFHTIIQERRREPREDLISAMCVAEETGQKLSEDELFAACVLLLAAGNETTTNLIGNGLLALLRNEDQLKLLRDNPELIEGAVEELLRYDSPVQMTARMALEDLQLGTRAVRKGQQVALLLGAANRDPAQFPDPDRLDITRAPGRHMAFGYGIHFCIGAPLARIEGQVAINALLRRMPELRLAGTPRWRDTILLRGLRSLPVAFAAPAAVAQVAVPAGSSA